MNNTEPLIPLELQEVLKNLNYTIDRDGILQLWQKTKEDLETVKAAEMAIRKVAVKLTVPIPREGMNNVELGNGYIAKAQIKYNYNCKTNDEVEKALSKISKIGNEGSFIADRLVSWTPNFLLSEYRELQEKSNNGDRTAMEILKIIPEFMVITEAAPTLEIKPPKDKRT